MRLQQVSEQVDILLNFSWLSSDQGLWFLSLFSLRGKFLFSFSFLPVNTSNLFIRGPTLHDFFSPWQNKLLSCTVKNSVYSSTAQNLLFSPSIQHPSNASLVKTKVKKIENRLQLFFLKQEWKQTTLSGKAVSLQVANGLTAGQVLSGHLSQMTGICTLEGPSRSWGWKASGERRWSEAAKSGHLF